MTWTLGGSFDSLLQGDGANATNEPACLADGREPSTLERMILARKKTGPKFVEQRCC